MLNRKPVALAQVGLDVTGGTILKGRVRLRCRDFYWPWPYSTVKD